MACRPGPPRTLQFLSQGSGAKFWIPCMLIGRPTLEPYCDVARVMKCCFQGHGFWCPNGCPFSSPNIVLEARAALAPRVSLFFDSFYSIMETCWCHRPSIRHTIGCLGLSIVGPPPYIAWTFAWHDLARLERKSNTFCSRREDWGLIPNLLWFVLGSGVPYCLTRYLKLGTKILYWQLCRKGLAWPMLVFGQNNVKSTVTRGARFQVRSARPRDTTVQCHVWMQPVWFFVLEFLCVEDVVIVLRTTTNDPWRACRPNCSSAVLDVLLSNAGRKYVHRAKTNASWMVCGREFAFSAKYDGYIQLHMLWPLGLILFSLSG